MTATMVRYDKDHLLASLQRVRAITEALATPLSDEDQCVQSMPDASPTKWHRAHTTWFFETFVLVPEVSGYRRFHDDYNFLFNSYYDAVGKRHARHERGLLTRPSSNEIARYRGYVDAALETFLSDTSPRVLARIAPIIELGMHHEQQHQELLLMDIKHALSRNSHSNTYCETPAPAETSAPRAEPTPALEFATHPGGIVDIGATENQFAFDNETPIHTALVQPFALANRLITNGEWKAFVADDGYARADLWLSDGWRATNSHNWNAPLYWEIESADPNEWTMFSLHGTMPISNDAPVTHVSYYEADAFARWSNARLATEFEWESVANSQPIEGNLAADDPTTLFSRAFATQAATQAASATSQMFGDAWEWTASSYSPYPRFAPAAGAIGEYNGKFMSNQMVLRGGSFATPLSHIRATYRNFFYPNQRWMFSGVRLARDTETGLQ